MAVRPVLRRSLAAVPLLAVAALLLLPPPLHVGGGNPLAPRGAHPAPGVTASMRSRSANPAAASLSPHPGNGSGGGGGNGSGGGGNGSSGGSGGSGGGISLNGPWTDLTPSLTSIPGPRQAFGLAYDPGLSAVVLFGGQDASGGALGDTWEFKAGSWSDLTANLTTAPSSRWGPGMVYDPAISSILLFGGRDATATWFNDTWTFNATGWHLLHPSVAPSPRNVEDALVYDAADGYVLLHDTGYGSSTYETWSFANGTWTNRTSLQTGTPPALYFHPVYDAADGYVVYFGGDPAGCTGFGLTWTYKNDTWTNLSASAGTPTAQMGSQAMTFDEELGTVVMFGGYTASCAVVDETWIFLNGTWSPLPTYPPSPPGVWDGRLAYDAAIQEDILVGGNGALYGSSNSFVDDTWALNGSTAPLAPITVAPTSGFSPLTVTFAVGTPEPYARAPIAVNWSFGDGSPNSTAATVRHNYTGVGTYSGAVDLVDRAGRTTHGSISIRVDPKPRGTWLELISSSSTATTPTPRQAFTMAYDPLLGGSILFGGQSAFGNALGDTWEFKDGSWTALSPSPSPSSRWAAAMVYDPAEQGLVLFGGRDQNSTWFNDTWLFNASGWTNITPPGPAPSPRNVDGSMAYDAADGYVLLFGGDHLFVGTFNDTWTFSQGAWTNVTATVTGTPPTAGYHAAYDEAANTTVFYGGVGRCAGPSVTWTYRAGTWTNITASAGSPTAAAGAGALTYDPIEKGVLISGGYTNSCAVTDQTWVLRNGTWFDITNTTASPTGRWDARMTFDPGLGGDLLWGGNENPSGGSNAFYGDTWEYHDGLNVSARADRSSGIVPLDVNLSVASITGGSGPYGYNWSFGDGSATSNASAPSHTYAQEGTYTVSVTVNDSTGRFGLSRLGIAVYGDLVLAPTLTPATGEAPLRVAFAANGSGGVPPVRYLWEFGDGNSSLTGSGSHTYTRSGNFSWNVTMTDAQGHTGFAAGTIQVLPALVVGLNASQVHGESPLTVTFTSNVSGGVAPYTYAWSFGDGSAGASTRVAIHTYAAPGTYSAWLNVTDALGITRGLPVTVQVVSPLHAGASASATEGQSPLTVSFGASPYGGMAPVTVHWTFGDGAGSSLPSPTHTYVGVGNYTATVTAVDAYNDSATAWFNITVVAPLAIALGGTPLKGETPLTVTFTANRSGGAGPFSYLWSFGDGATSTVGPVVTHTYTRVDAFTATLTVSDAYGASVHQSVAVLVGAVEEVAVATTSAIAYLGSSVNLTASVTGGFPAYAYAWSDLPPGCQAQPAAELTCAPTRVGNYTVHVTVTDSIGDRANGSVTVVVESPPPAGPAGVSGSTTLLLGVGIVAVAAVALVGLLVYRRRRGAAAPTSEAPMEGAYEEPPAETDAPP
jgi:PKD repeat protein